MVTSRLNKFASNFPGNNYLPLLISRLIESYLSRTFLANSLIESIDDMSSSIHSTWATGSPAFSILEKSISLLAPSRQPELFVKIQNKISPYHWWCKKLIVITNNHFHPRLQQSFDNEPSDPTISSSDDSNFPISLRYFWMKNWSLQKQDFKILRNILPFNALKGLNASSIIYLVLINNIFTQIIICRKMFWRHPIFECSVLDPQTTRWDETWKPKRKARDVCIQRQNSVSFSSFPGCVPTLFAVSQLKRESKLFPAILAAKSWTSLLNINFW